MPFVEARYIPYHAVSCIGKGNALVFAPHPDDEVFGCAGAILSHKAQGDSVRVIIVTDGEFGAGAETARYADTRRTESRQAARVLGYGQPEFWGLPDRGVVCDDMLVQRMVDAITDMATEFVYAPSWWEIHPDHTAVSRAVTEAARISPVPAKLVLYEVGVPMHPNLLLDMTNHVQLKSRAMSCFPSQMSHQSYGEHIAALNVFRTYTLPSTVRSAEAYRVIAVNELPDKIDLPLMSHLNSP